MDAWAAFVAPAGTPPEIVAMLNKTMRPIIDSAEVKEQLGRVGFEGFSSSSEELGAFIKAQLGNWEKMIKDAGIREE